ncbi:MAG: tetrahydrofolate dehydrogenase/cyclohydrolase catalytic domain-containing protein, partial [Vicinamibacterales bacterium]
MSARILDGTAVAATIRAEVAPAVSSFTQRAGRRPRLTLVLVGDNPSSELYVSSKLKSAGETGLDAQLERLPADAPLEELLRLVDRLNNDDSCDGILV